MDDIQLVLKGHESWEGGGGNNLLKGKIFKQN
jgi:hypothetical protein